LGADTRATEGPIVCDKNCEKIHYIAPNIYCCGAGTSADTENTTGHPPLHFFSVKFYSRPNRSYQCSIEPSSPKLRPPNSCVCGHDPTQTTSLQVPLLLFCSLLPPLLPSLLPLSSSPIFFPYLLPLSSSPLFFPSSSLFFPVLPLSSSFLSPFLPSQTQAAIKDTSALRWSWEELMPQAPLSTQFTPMAAQIISLM
jgi:Proteasome subunit